jgi:hypothetical protein
MDLAFVMMFVVLGVGIILYAGLRTSMPSATAPARPAEAPEAPVAVVPAETSIPAPDDQVHVDRTD